MLSCLVALSACSTKGSAGKGSGEEASLYGQNDVNSDRESRFGAGSIPIAEAEGRFRDVYFNYDSSQISDKGRQDIEYNLQVLEQDPSLKVVLEGHCDERGTAEYNLALGQRRAQSAFDYLRGLGVEENRMSTVSYGEDQPLDPRSNEEAWSRNRRAHFRVEQ